jgi:ribitol-5-phosphate 2-dehydrogenase (NADP+) / D-ribitol-5-phosphate cytidylyltransferase
MKNVAVILSGGVGSRFGGLFPKQFAKLAGRSVIEYTIDAFENCLAIDEIIIVSKMEFIEKIYDIARNNNWKKIKKVITGGETRFESTYSAIASMKDYSLESNIIFHDSVRPLVTDKIITDAVKHLNRFDAVDIVVDSSDTLVQVGDDGCILSIPDRAHMRRGQTPQAFKLKTIAEAYDLAYRKKRFTFTCDCGVVRAMLPHVRIATVEGSERNIKITRPLDLYLAEKLLQSGDANSEGKFDLNNAKNKVFVIFGGTSGIGLAIKNLAMQKGGIVEVCSRKHLDVNVADRDSVDRYLKDINVKHGKIDAIINTAGLLIKKPITQMTSQEVQSAINVNLHGAINVALASHDYLRKSWGSLLNFTSSSHTRGRAYYSLYSSTKSAVVNFTQALAEEWASDGIRVNCINPERTATPMRVANFGIEPEETLLSAHEVAVASLNAILMDRTGMIVDVKKTGLTYE